MTSSYSGPLDRHRRRSVATLVAGLVAAATALAVLAFPAGASAHGSVDDDGYSNYESRVLSVVPPVPGLEITTYGVAGGIRIENRSGQDVVVLGYDNEPYLRINSSGTYVNLNSRATYTNMSPDANVDVPERASTDPTAEPEWVQTSSRKYVRWHDHRSHWMGTEPPDAVEAAPSQRHVVYDGWEIPLVVNSKPVTVTGELVYVPPPSRTQWLLIALAVFGGATLILYVLRSSRAMLLLALLGALGCNAVIAASRATAEDVVPSRRLWPFITGGVVVLLLLIGSFSKKKSGPPLLWGIAGAVLVGASVAYFKALSFSAVDGAPDASRIRWSVVVELGLGAAIAMLAIVSTIENWMINRSVASLMAEHEANLAARDEAIAEGLPTFDGSSSEASTPLTHPPHSN